MDINKERKEFEESIIKKCGFNPEKSFELGSTGEYKSDVTFFAWAMWLASVNREGFVLMPKVPSDAIKKALSYKCFDFISVANVYRNLGFDIPKKAEDEQSFFLHKFLLLAITHGNDFVKVFNEETKKMVEAQEPLND